MHFRESLFERPFFPYIYLPGWFSILLCLISVSTYNAASQTAISIEQPLWPQVNKSLVHHIWISDHEHKSPIITIKGKDDSLAGKKQL